MNLDTFCSEYRIKKSSPPENDTHDPDIHLLIENYQADTLRYDEKQKFLKRVICQNSKIRKVWTEVKKFIIYRMNSFYFGNKEMAESSAKQMMECCSVILQQSAENCLKKFDIRRSSVRDNQNIFALLSGFISQSVHYRKVVKDIGLENLNNQIEISVIDRIGSEDDETPEICIVSNEASPEREAILNDLLKKIMADFESSPRRVRFSDFVNESISRQDILSDKARQQKKRLRDFLKKQWDLDDNFTDDIIEKIIAFLTYRKKI